jgi:hypothetical protein
VKKVCQVLYTEYLITVNDTFFSSLFGNLSCLSIMIINVKALLILFSKCVSYMCSHNLTLSRSNYVLMIFKRKKYSSTV